MTGHFDHLTSALADRYRVERELGAGGMATVYLAQDLKHDRKVAIKVLRPELSAVIGAERFLREIKTIANLQHPHILGLIDSGEVGGTAYYVMPFVEGESLRDRLTREKQLPIADALRLATEIAGALDYAHRHGIIHRDIKPENILLHDGRALVADFGIALAASNAGGSRMTETGMSLGTPHYMSPEQAMGEREITARSDVYALGCVTYEMLVGEPPFTGPTAQAIVAKVMTSEPASITAQRRSVPAAVDDAVMVALEKLPADRFATAAEFAAALSGGPTGRTTTRSMRVAQPGRAPWRRISIGLGVVSVALLALAVWAMRREPSAGPSVYDAALPDSAGVGFAVTSSAISYGAPLRNLSIAPAGDFAVYAARQGDSTELWYRSLSNGDVRRLPGTRGATAPRISPDGKRVAFVQADRVLLLTLAGGEPRVLLQRRNADALGWMSNVRLAATTDDGNNFNWIDAGGGASRTKAIPRCAFGRWIPELGQLLCSYNRGGSLLDPETGSTGNIRVARPDGTPGDLLAGSAFALVDKRYLVYSGADGALLGARYDAAKRLAYAPVTLLAGVRREALGDAQFDIAATGTLVYAPGVDATVGRLVTLHAGGAPQPLSIETGDFQRFDLSPDRRWMAASVQGTGGSELRVYDLQNG